jgi:CHRD domain
MRISLQSVLLIGTLLIAGGAVDAAQPEPLLLAHLHGFQEVPSVSTAAHGEFRATISKDEQSIKFELTYEGLQNTVTQSHIHVAQRGVNGSIVIWLCGTQSNPGPTGTQTCPQTAKGITTVSGTIHATDVIAASTTSQLILAGELAEVIAAIRGGVAYANVHSTPLTTGGEIRGQIRVVRSGRD